MRHSLPMLYLLYINRNPGVALLPFGAILGVGWCALTLMMFIPSIKLHIVGSTTDATVTAKQISARDADPFATRGALFAHGGKRGPRWTVQVSFSDSAGNPQTARLVLSKSDGDVLQPGDTLRIRFDPENPQRIELASNWSTTLLLLPFLAVGVAITTICSWFFIAEARDVRNCVQIIRNGTAVPGRVTCVTAEYRGRRKSDRFTVIAYEFAGPDGATGGETVKHATLELAGKAPTGITSGCAIVVLVDPDDAARFAPDIFFARTEAFSNLFG